MRIKIQDNNGIFVCRSAIVDGTDLWMLTNETNILCHFDLNNMNLKEYFLVPGEELIENLHLTIRKHGDIIFIIPCKSEYLYFFDVESKKFWKHQIPYDKHKNNKFVIAETYGSRLIMIGHEVHGIICYDDENDIFTQHTDYLSKLEKEGCDISKPVFLDCYYKQDDKLYIPVYSSNFIVQINLNDISSKVYKLTSDKKIQLHTIDRYNDNGEKFLLTTTNDEALIWSIDNGIEKMEELKVLKGNDRSYTQALHVNGKNFFISTWERKAFVGDEYEIRELEFDYESEGAVTEFNHTQFEAIFRYDRDIIFQARSNGQLFKIDTETEEVKCINFNVSQERRREIVDQVIKNRRKIGLLMESSFWKLELFLKRVCNDI